MKFEFKLKQSYEFKDMWSRSHYTLVIISDLRLSSKTTFFVFFDILA